MTTPPTTTDQLREAFLRFFERHGHTICPSDSLVPRNDPTVLFTPAGMNQFKDAFLGTVDLGFTRAASCQKCLRTTDIDEVGRTTYHHSFFEMLGNFSFGDYFKREAIEYAWEFMREVLRIPAERMRVSVYEEDEEAYRIWAEVIGLPREWIYRFDAHENFWPADAPTQSPPGTLCGPDTEIFVDLGPEVGCGRSECSPACDCGRFPEVWNLVFQQFEKGERPGELRRLATNNVDTGMGLERLAAVMQGKVSDYDIDVFAPLVARSAELLRRPPDRSGWPADVRRRLNRIADHIRAVVFCLADGVQPANEGRGYVERRLLRRAALDGMQLGAQTPFLFRLVSTVVEVMRGGYPELADRADEFAETIRHEEELFLQVVDQRSPMIRRTCRQLAEAGEGILPGEVAADWAQTHGVPVELSEAIAAEFGLRLDLEGYRRAMEQHRQLSRAASAFTEEVFSEATRKARLVRERIGGNLASQFVGYRALKATGRVLAILDGEGRLREEAGPEEGTIEVLLDRTPFYAEAGGQAPDRGRLTARGVEFVVLDVQRGADLIWHRGEARRGRLRVGRRLTCLVDADRRAGLARSHTATHLLHYALRTVLGGHIRQAGSRVEDGYLTFDFTHPGALSDEERRRIEDLVNQLILDDQPVRTREMPLEEAKRAGAIMLFGEKYGQRVRVVSAGNYSRELCGGTHVLRTGQIGMFRITGEESVAAGVRRITAATGLGVLERLRQQEGRLVELADLLRAPVDALVVRARGLVEENRRLRRDLQRALERGAVESADDILHHARTVGNTRIVARFLGEVSIEQLRRLADSLRNKSSRLLALLAGVREGKVQMVALATRDLVEEGIRADLLVRQVAPVVRGGGGGRPDLAQAGGKDPSRIEEAIQLAWQVMERTLSGGNPPNPERD